MYYQAEDGAKNKKQQRGKNNASPKGKNATSIQDQKDNFKNKNKTDERKDAGKPVAKLEKHQIKQTKKDNAKTEEKGQTSFQGQKANLKNKKKESKFEKKKKALAAKLTAKPKKPVKI